VLRDISVFPSTEEILSIGPGELAKKLSPNIVEGKYKNVMHYLDTHFRLLREDCLQPLREGIKGYIAHKQARSSGDYFSIELLELTLLLQKIKEYLEILECIIMLD
jgi:hypothetical protein